MQVFNSKDSYPSLMESLSIDNKLELLMKEYSNLQSQLTKMVEKEYSVENTWSDYRDIDFLSKSVNPPTAGQSNKNWKFLGKTNSLTKCKNKAFKDKKNIYNNVVYFDNDYNNSQWKKHCYGGLYGSEIGFDESSEVTSSIPEYGTTKIKGLTTKDIQTNMSNIESEIQNLLKSQGKILNKLENQDVNYEDKKCKFEKKRKLILQQIAINDAEIKKLQKDQSSEGEEQYSELSRTSDKYKYIVHIIAVLIMVGFTIKILSSSSENISFVTILIVTLLFISQLSYYYNVTIKNLKELWQSFVNFFTM